MKAILITLCLLLVNSSIFAGIDGNARSLLPYLRIIAENNGENTPVYSSDTSMMIGYTMGLVAGVGKAIEEMQDKGRISKEAKLGNIGDRCRIVYRYLSEHPEQGGLNDGMVVLLAYVECCQKQ